MSDVFSASAQEADSHREADAAVVSGHTPQYLHDWSEADWRGRTGLELLKAEFSVDDAAMQGVNVLIASCTYEDYSGGAYVLFERDGSLFEVTGGHCSCFGLEGQWEPEAVTLDGLKASLEKSSYYGHECRPELEAFVAKATTDGEGSSVGILRSKMNPENPLSDKLGGAS